MLASLLLRKTSIADHSFLATPVANVLPIVTVLIAILKLGTEKTT